MSPTPRLELNADYAAFINCPICGEAAVKVVHMDRLPDFISCDICGSAFVVEDGGENLMYGKISDLYPNTKQFALRQWMQLEAIEQHAFAERSPPEPVSQPSNSEAIPSGAIPIPTEPDSQPPPGQPVSLDEEPSPEAYPPAIEPSFPPEDEEMSELDVDIPESLQAPDIIPSEGLEPSPAYSPWKAQPKTPPQDVGVSEVGTGLPISPPIAEKPGEPGPPLSTTPPLPSAVEEKGEDEPIFVPRPSDPPLGQRYRVVIKGTKVKFPGVVCAHCLRSPVRPRLAVAGTLPVGQVVGQRQNVSFTLPLCSDCRKRATQKHPDEKSDRLVAHLISALVAMLLLVAALAWGVNLQENPLMGVIILMILAFLGYAIPAWLQLRRIRPLPPPPDAIYVRSTLLIPSDIQSVETAFEFRNQGYAERFHSANEPYTLGKVTPVKDRNPSLVQRQ